MKLSQNLWNTCAGLLLLFLALALAPALSSGAGTSSSSPLSEKQREVSASLAPETQGPASPTQNNEQLLEKKRVALTFDDGPHPLYTPKLLEGLQEESVSCSFFLLGSQAQEYPELVKEMYSQGHLLGNHSYNHVILSRLPDSQACDQVNRTSQLLRELTGEPATYLRPPYGEWNEKLSSQVDMIPVLWTLDSLDWSLQNTEAIVRRVVSTVEDGDIILMHDSFPTSVEAAIAIVRQLKKQGYDFVTVDELIVK